MEKNLMHILKVTYTNLSKSQKLIADYITNHYDKAAFMTAAKIGEEVKVSESTVVRFANTLGYSGYPDMKEALQDLTKIKLTTVQRLDMEEYSNKEVLIKKVLKKDMENIKYTMDDLDIDVFENVINTILGANKVFIIGLRSSNALAEYLGFYLRMMLKDVTVVNNGISDMFEQVLKVTEGDVIIGISYPRYSKKTLDVVKYTKKRGAKIISITDRKIAPIVHTSDFSLFAETNMHSFVDSLVAPMSLINSLIVKIGEKMKKEITEYFTELENIWKEYDVYDDNYKE